LIVTSAVVIAAIAFLAAWTSRRMVGVPVGAIVRGADLIAGGELGTRVTATGSREIVRLGGAFNEMGARLEEAQREATANAEEHAAVERRLRHIQALAAAGQIAASVAHEIGSPLNIILGRARRGAEHPECSEPLRRELESIATQSERITRVVSGLLTLARPARGSERRADALEIVDSVMAFVAPEARRRGVTTHVEGREQTATLAIDPDLLFQVFFNLVMNGIQAADGGTVTVRFAAPTSDGRAVIEVRDLGPGVSPDEAARMFEAFYTTKSDAGGSGLGLAIVAGILRDAGGSIELIQREATPGALFRALVPVVRARAVD
jgi:signal transduction histidine kinase